MDETFEIHRLEDEVYDAGSLDSLSCDGDAAVKSFVARFEHRAVERLLLEDYGGHDALEKLEASVRDAMTEAARRIRRYHERQLEDTVSFEYENGVRGTLHLCMFALDFPNEDLEMGIIGDAGMLVTRISRIEILQWKRGSNQRPAYSPDFAPKRA